MSRSIKAATFLTFLVLVGCDTVGTVQAPEMTMVIMDASGFTVVWEKNDAIESSVDFAGYNVYVSTDSAALLTDNGEDLNKINSQVITDTLYHAGGLSQDSIYYVQVRTVNIEAVVGGYNADTPFLTASPRPEWTVTLRLSPIPPSGTDSCALRYVDGSIMADSVMVDSTADMWVATAGDSAWFCAPDEHPLYGVGARATLFIYSGPAEFDSLSVVPAQPDTGLLVVAPGEMAIARTEDGNYVKLRVEALDTVSGTITVLYAYQNIAGFPYF